MLPYDGRVQINTDEVRRVAARMLDHQRDAREVANVLAGMEIPLAAGDALSQLTRFTQAFAEFRDAWSREVGLAADACADITAGLNFTASEIDRADREGRDGMLWLEGELQRLRAGR